MRKGLFGLLVLFLPVLASAQTPIDVNRTFSLHWDLPTAVPGAAPISGFRVELNGTPMGADLAPTATSQAFAAQTACGPAQTLRVGSVWSGGVQWSQPVQFQIVNCPPGPPTNLRIERLRAYLCTPLGTQSPCD